MRKNKYSKSWTAKRRETQAAAAKHRATRMRELAPNVQAHRLDDNCWWEVCLAAIPTRTVRWAKGREYVVPDAFTDVVLRAKLSKLPPEELYGQPGLYAAAKRQLSRREIADLKVQD